MKLFNAIRVRKPGYNLFDLSHEKKLSCNMGDLVPIYLEEIVPGDKFRVNTEMLVRLAPMVAPMMHRVNVFTHYFFVPNRLIWSNWEDFITGGEDGTEAPTFPTFNLEGATYDYFQKGSLGDYFGLPVIPGVVSNEATVSGLPFRAYQMIYNEYYRDQTLQAKIAFPIGNDILSDDYADLFTLRKRCWEKDYFTSSLPWTQRGTESIIPGTPDYKIPAQVQAVEGTPYTGHAGNMTIDADGDVRAGDVNTEVGIDNLEGYDISVNQLRLAVRVQQWLERNARAGSRYVEQIFAHFGIKSSDSRLARPEYLGGGKCPVVVSEVVSTAETTENPQGTMAGHGIAVGNTHRFQKSFEEHGFVIGIMSILPRTCYQQGIEKLWLKTDKFDYYFPEFASIGEQPVLNGELYHDFAGTQGDSEETFGYQSRYAEYKYKQSSVHAQFKDDFNYWHMGRIFASAPALNSAFVSADPTHRVFAVTTESVHKCYVQLYNNVKAIRPMPIFSEPGL